MTATAWLVVLAVIRDGERFLAIQERDGTWYLPAGKVERGEDLVAAALRDTQEEAGVAVTIGGVLAIEHVLLGTERECLRVVFSGSATSSTTPKRHADEHSLGAAWCTRDELAGLPLRHDEVLRWIDRAIAGDALLPARSYVVRGAPRPRR